MPRTVVPPVRYRSSSNDSSADARTDGGARPTGGDGLPERLVKYVPAETLAFFVPLASAIGGDRDVLLVTVLAVGLAGTVGYLWLHGQRAEPDVRPLPHFYVLSALAFLAWAIGTSGNVSALVRLDQVAAGVVLGLAVFLIPLLDEVLNRRLGR
jgi:hypothetical protein